MGSGLRQSLPRSFSTAIAARNGALEARPLERERGEESCAHLFEDPVLGPELAECVGSARLGRPSDKRGVGFNDVQRGHLGDCGRDVLSFLGRARKGFQNIGNADEALAALVGRHRDRLLEPLARAEVGASNERSKHPDRGVGERRFEVAQRRDQYRVSTCGSYLLERLRGQPNTFSGHLREAWAVRVIELHFGSAGRAQPCEFVEISINGSPPMRAGGSRSHDSRL